MGWMVRQNLDADAPYADCAEHGDGLTSLQFRRTKGAKHGADHTPNHQRQRASIRATREHQHLSAARYGETFVSRRRQTSIQAMKFTWDCSPVPIRAKSWKTIFRDVRIIRPVKEGFTPYRDYIGSVLEILDVQSGEARNDSQFQAAV